MADGGESPVDRGILSQQEVSDRLEILDLLATYCRGIDERDFDLLWSVFTPDSTIDYSRAGGISGTAAEAIAWVTESLRSSQWSQHVVTLRDLELTSESGTTTRRSFTLIMVALWQWLLVDITETTLFARPRGGESWSVRSTRSGRRPFGNSGT
jgi:hypothetical protein